MKKHNAVAVVGTLALLANLLVPGLAFGQNQTGTAQLNCSETLPSFTEFTPATAFNFTADGASLGTTNKLYAKSTDQWAFNNENGGSSISTDPGNDYIEVNDPRDPSDPSCNLGLRLNLTALDNDNNGAYFERTTLDGVTIPLNQVYMVTSNATGSCPSGYNAIGQVCYAPDALCGTTKGGQAGTCNADDGTVAPNLNYTGSNFATDSTYSANGTDKAIGSDNNTPKTNFDILTFVQTNQITHGLYGKAGLVVSYGVHIPAKQQAGIYTLNLQYTLYSDSGGQ